MKKAILLICAITSASFAARIGVLKADQNMKCSEEILIDMDTEDSNSDTKVVSGDKNPPGISLGGHAKFTYCVLDISTMPQSPFDYAVLRLDSKCPKNGQPLSRHHDNEDSKNANSYKGKISPNVVNSNATLEYCFVEKTSSPNRKYPFNKSYGVFANPSSKTNMAHSEIKIDDEDNKTTKVVGQTCGPISTPICTNFQGATNCTIVTSIQCQDITESHNSNSWNYKDLAPSRIDRVKKIMSGTDNTTYHVVKWTGSSSAILAKAANMEYATSAANSQAISVSIAATIKNVTRTGINIDLQSAGDVEISIVGINGSSFAKINQKNMQPGIHSISWNSANIPNGRYIATIKQNGMVRGKNIILK